MAAANLSNYEVDVVPLVHLLVNDEFLSMEDGLELLKEHGELPFLVKNTPTYGFPEPDDEKTRVVMCEVDDVCKEISDELGNLTEPHIFVQSLSGMHGNDRFEEISDDASDASENNLLSCFLRFLNGRGVQYSVSLRQRTKIGEYSGFSTGQLADGADIYSKTIVVSVPK